MDDLFTPKPPQEPGMMPSAQLAAYMAGNLDASDAIKSWAKRFIYDAAVTICAMSTLEARRAALAKVPPGLRELVQVDMARVWRG